MRSAILLFAAVIVSSLSGCRRADPALSRSDISSLHVATLRYLMEKTPETRLYYVIVVDGPKASARFLSPEEIAALPKEATYRKIEALSDGKSDEQGASPRILGSHILRLESVDLVEVDGSSVPGPLDGIDLILRFKRDGASWKIVSERIGRIF